jgi:cyclopropane fatty-acyl-phospholipid synthase-like methyltransferase
MWEGSRDHYFESGRSAVQCVRLGMLAAEVEGFTNILDFPSGWGRSLRMLAAAFPEARLTACDLDREGVDFCADRLGAAPVYSNEDPAKIGLEPGFDLIWCGSLLTHLPAARWNDFLTLFQSILAPGGLLVVTSHGRYVADFIKDARDRLEPGDDELIYGIRPDRLDVWVEDFEREGFAYQEYDYWPGYGTSVATPAWVCTQLAALSELQLKCYTERGWHDHQDAVACLRV